MKLRAFDPVLVTSLRRSTPVLLNSLRPTASFLFASQYPPTLPVPSNCRAFTATAHAQSWLIPKRGHSQKNRKGRCRVPTGGSTRGTTVVWGDYGIRLRDHDRRISSTQLATGIEAIRKRLRGERYRLFTRVSANIGVYTSGNEVRMGKGKGAFDYWAARVAVSQIIFEVRGELHEQVVRDAMRLAGNKMPGLYEFVKKGDPPVMGLTKMTEGLTMADMRRPRIKLPADVKAGRIPASMPGPPPDLAPPTPTPSAATPPSN